ncbi:hypothetical protein RZ70_03210 [Apilactobacillus kunkeei]|uniref:hypothetical protein n=1 Tax=Apilactobacillus kunkeei TaxID=148814 RepID=UPI0006C4D83A|nr:hypothetical protein [Apilactobacillus kunkeei]KOY73704.1 hypothetical protein RZ70_03210 [Apilactobacillus kunkeei]
MIKVKNVLLTALVATFMVGGIASVEEASVNANAQTVHVHHAKKHAKKHTKKHTKKHSKKRVVKKHVKKSAKKHVRKVAKKHVAKKHVRKVAKKHVAKKHVRKVAKKHVAKKATKKVMPRLQKDAIRGTKNTDNNPANPLARNNKRVALPQDTDYVGYVYTYGRGFNSAKNIGRVSPYLKNVAVREDGMSDADYANVVAGVKMANEGNKESAQQGSHPYYNGGALAVNGRGYRGDYQAYVQAVEKYGWKVTKNDWGL